MEKKKVIYKSCLNIENNFEIILGFNKDILKWEFSPSIGQFSYNKYPQNFNEREANFQGNVNQTRNSGSMFIDRVNNIMIHTYISNDKIIKKKFKCKNIEKPKKISKD
jgi:hypothetical protein